MAKVAEACLAENAEGANIELHGCNSTELRVGHELPRRAQLLVSEIVDSQLLGEGILPSLRHAMEVRRGLQWRYSYPGFLEGAMFHRLPAHCILSCPFRLFISTRRIHLVAVAFGRARGHYFAHVGSGVGTTCGMRGAQPLGEF